MSHEPWKHEPDLVRFGAHGIRCVVRRVKDLGHLCGYVQLPEGHPWACLGYDVPAVVHGGVTYSEISEHFGGGHWIGFDCAHSGDLSPGLGVSFQRGEYRDIEYVKGEVYSLAAQVQAVMLHAKRFGSVSEQAEAVLREWGADREILEAFFRAWWLEARRRG